MFSGSITIQNFNDQELRWAYDELLHKQPQKPEYRAARLRLLDLIEERAQAEQAKIDRQIQEYRNANISA